MSAENIRNYPYKLTQHATGNVRFMSARAMHACLSFDEAVNVGRLPIGRGSFVDVDGDTWERVA